MHTHIYINKYKTCIYIYIYIKHIHAQKHIHTYLYTSTIYVYIHVCTLFFWHSSRSYAYYDVSTHFMGGPRSMGEVNKKSKK